jgi:hypothetical protein
METIRFEFKIDRKIWPTLHAENERIEQADTTPLMHAK